MEIPESKTELPESSEVLPEPPLPSEPPEPEAPAEPRTDSPSDSPVSPAPPAEATPSPDLPESSPITEPAITSSPDSSPPPPPPVPTLPPQSPEPSELSPAPVELHERIVLRELTDDEKSALYRERLKTLSTKGNQSRSTRRLANHAKIVEHLQQHGYITNNEVQKLCGVKDSTATKYLKDLQRLGRIIPVGKTRYIRWRLTQAI